MYSIITYQPADPRKVDRRYKIGWLDVRTEVASLRADGRQFKLLRFGKVILDA